MRTVSLLLTIGLAALAGAGCGDSSTRCEYGGRTYRPGESYPLDCNTCICQEDGTFSCTAIACVDAGGDGGGDGGVDAGPDASPDADRSDAGLDCESAGSSDLAEVSIEFPEQPCVFTLAEAAAGITIDYRTVVSSAVTAVTTRPQDAGGCGTPGDSGLILFERLSGGGQSYCLCDTGLCPGMDATSDLAAGEYASSFSWMGRNWGGPSDTGMPMGEPFPPGSYTLEVSAVGTHEGAPISISGTFVVHLVP